MTPTRRLPDGYAATRTLDLSTDRRALLALNIASIPLTLLAVVAFGAAIGALRPDFGTMDFAVEGLGGLLRALAALVAIFAVAITLHEAVHGLFFWLFTRSRPRFGFRGLYAYAAAPEWYLPRNLYLVVALAPLVLLSVAGLLLALALPASWLPVLLLALVINAGGAVGDLYVAALLLRRPPTLLANDVGDHFTFYEREA